MYIGDIGKRGLHHLIYEVVDNSVDEALGGFCTKVSVIFNEDNSVSVEDNGRGIPVDIHKTEKKPALEVVMTVLHAGGKFDKGSYKISGGLHGVGVSVVNALSSWLVAEVYRDGQIYKQKYERGNAVTKVGKTGKTKKGGTKITFMPDSEVFTEIQWDFELIADRLRELAYLNKGLEISLIDRRKEEERFESYKFKGGLSDFIKFLDSSTTPLHNKVITITKENGDVPVDVAMRYGEGYTENILSFVNNINTIEGGTHLSGFRSALTRGMNSYGNKNNLIKGSKGEKITLSGEDFREGLTAVLSVKIAEPQFEGQTKTKLGNGEVKGLVDAIVYEGIQEFLEQNPSIAKRIINKSIDVSPKSGSSKKSPGFDSTKKCP